MDIDESISSEPSHRPANRLLIPTLLATFLLLCGNAKHAVVGPLLNGGALAAVPARAYYVDCSAPAGGDGSNSTPWNSLARISATTFRPGDRILFKRGSACKGILEPLGSGTASSPIVIDAYGTGPQPIIDGEMNTAAVQLVGQQGWEIQNLEISGGDRFGIYIAGSAPNTAYAHFRLTNLNVHGAHYVSKTTDDSDEILITIGNTGESIDDVVLDGVSAHDSKVNNGIYIDAGTPFNSSPPILGKDITIRNSTVYNVYELGMTIFAATYGLMENNVVHNAGQCPPHPGCGPGATGGMMDLYCHSCVMQDNESFDIEDFSPWDGGDFDIDVWNQSNVVQYNYGHDSIGYCVSLFSANHVVSSNNIIRYNVCSNNSRLANSPDPGEIFMNTNGADVSGALDGVQVYNNTFYWNPATPGPAFNTVNASFTGTRANFFKNNIVYSTVPNLIKTTSDFELDNNIYWTTGTGPIWNFDGTRYTNFASYQSATGEDRHGKYTDPGLNAPGYHAVPRPVLAFTLSPHSPALNAGANVCIGISDCSMGTRDFWGRPLPERAGYNIGAWQ